MRRLLPNSGCRNSLEGSSERVNRGGFTLVEVMISIALLVTLSVALYSSFSLMTIGQRATDKLQERYHTARVAMTRMTRELSMAFLSKHVNDEEPRSKTIFEGEKDRVLFTTLSHQRRIKGVPESDQEVVEYSLKSMRKQRGKGLYRRVKTILDDDPEKEGQEELLAEGVKSIEFEYWDRQEEDWESHWDVSSDDFEVGGALAALTGSKKISEEVTDEDKTLQLPWRVKIILELIDDEREVYTFESQAKMYIREPLDFTLGGSLTNQSKRLGKGGAGGLKKGGATRGAPSKGKGGR